MAITVVGVGTAASGTGAVSPGLPSGTAANDILVMICETTASAGVGEAVTVSGWTEAGSSPQTATSTRITVFWKRAGSSESAPTTNDPGDHIIAQIIGVRGCVTSGDPFDATAGNFSNTVDTSISIPGVTTTVANCLIIAAVAVGSGSTGTGHFSGWTNGNLTSLTEQIDVKFADGNGGGIGAATGFKATTGATGSTTATLVASDRKAFWCGALKPSTNPDNLTANEGTLSFTAQSANLNLGNQITANEGALTLTAQSADLTFSGDSPTLTANEGTLSLTGQNAALSYSGDNFTLTANAGTLSLTGENIPLTATDAPKTPIFTCGFECGQLVSDTQTHWGTNAFTSISTTTVRSGARSLRVNPSAQTSSVLSAHGITTVIVARFYIRFAALPNVDCYLAWAGASNGRIGLAFKQSTSTLHCSALFSPNPAGAGVAVTTGVWYRVDMKLNQTSGAKVCDIKIDGVVLTQATSTSTDSATTWVLGVSPSASGDWFIDDTISSSTAADYPFGDGFVNHFVPVSDGSHNTGSAGNFKVGAAGSNITDATTDSYTLIDEVPLDDTTPDTNDYINAAADTGAGSNYVEHVLGAAPGISTPAIAPRGVDVIVAYHQAGTGTGNSTFKINDNGTENTVLAFNAAGQTTTRYARKHYSRMPSGGAAWTVGRFNALRSRFGYSTDGNPDQYFDSLMVEAEFASTDLSTNVGTLTLTPQSASLTHSGEPVTAGAGTLTLTGESATLTQGFTLTALPGTITFAPEDVFSFHTVVLPFGSTFDLFLQIVPATTETSVFRHKERCFVDGTPLKFSDFTLTAPDRRIGLDLELTLADINQRSLITKDAVFQFDISIDNGATWHTIFNAGRWQSENFEIAWGDVSPDDKFSFTVVSGVDDSAPTVPTVLYDPARLTLNADDFEVLTDSEGNEIAYSLEEVPGLSTWKLFSRLATELGYTTFKSNIPNYQLRRAQWALTSVWIQPVAEKISPFDALIYPVGDQLWFQDATMPITEGSPTPEALTIDKYKSAAFSSEDTRIDGFLVNYMPNEHEYDDTEVRIETPPDDVEGGTRTAIQIYYLDFYKNGKVIRSQYEATFKQIYGYHQYSGTTRQIGSFEEQIQYDSRGQQIGSSQVEEALVYSGGLWVLQEIKRKPSVYEFAGHPYKPDSIYLKRKAEVESGTIAENSDEDIFGSASRYGYRDALRRESITDSTTFTTGDIYARIENYKIETKDRVRVSGRKLDLLKGIAADEYDEPRTGDISIDGNSTETKPIAVYADDRRGLPLRDFAGDEVPWEYLEPLTKRSLYKLFNNPGGGSCEKWGWVLGLRRGLTKALYYRSDVFLFNFLVEGYVMQGSNLGDYKNAVRKTTLSGRKI